MTESADPNITECLWQAHDQMHKGNHEAAHEMIHKGLGIDNEDTPFPAAPGRHRLDFDTAFRTACRKNGAKAMYVLVDGVSEKGSRLLSGGDAELVAFIDEMIRARARSPAAG
jgi:hypothetical protein